MTTTLIRISLSILLLLSFAHPTFGETKPNLIYILADDLGYGDVHALNPDGKIKTPNLDRLASQGTAFTDAHSGSAVCTPTRYGVLTGRYSWRSRLQSGVCWGFSRRLIEPDRMTVASILKQHGYHTAAVGKWHLGIDWPTKSGGIAHDDDRWDPKYKGGWDVDFSKPIQNGPLSIGFDYFFGISASLDMPPYVYIENDRPVVKEIVSKGWPKQRTGPADIDFEAEDVLPKITEKAVGYIHDRAAAAKKGEPFFLYFPLTAPHTPILPTPEWQGKSKMNVYADFVMQVDHTVGEVMKALDDAGLAENTLLIFTSDNGCSPQAKFAELAKYEHDPSYVFRGHKADIYEGGHRVPFIARWPGTVAKGATSSQLICLTDLFATCAAIVGGEVPGNAGEDSVSILPALDGSAREPIREAVVHHSINGSFAIRQGNWKLSLCPGSGGWSSPRPQQAKKQKLPSVQLYNLQADIGEAQNVQQEHEQVVEKLTSLAKKYIDQGRSTPGPQVKNDASIKLLK